MKITILGAGLIGSAIVKDLAKDYFVTAVDLNTKALDALSSTPNVEVHQADLSNPPEIEKHIATADLVVSAVPGFMGFNTLKTVINAGKNVVDIAFFPEDAFLLDALAKDKNVTAVVDCGVAPGLCNTIAGYLSTKYDSIESYSCYVGGLPRVREFPYEYKAVFSPTDVIEEYTRPARYIKSGEQIVKPALSDIELIDFPGVGTLEAFNTDGLRSLVHTIKAPNMIEKTLRYPGHAELMRAYRETGFFSQEEIKVDGVKVKPLSLISKLMFDKWQLKDGEADFTVMLVELECLDGEKKVKHSYYLLDDYEHEQNITSMARTTGYTAAIVARQVLKGEFKQPGINPPEYVGRVDGCFSNLLAEYEKRNIKVTETIS